MQYERFAFESAFVLLIWRRKSWRKFQLNRAYLTKVCGTCVPQLAVNLIIMTNKICGRIVVTTIFVSQQVTRYYCDLSAGSEKMKRTNNRIFFFIFFLFIYAQTETPSGGSPEILFCLSLISSCIQIDKFRFCALNHSNIE